MAKNGIVTILDIGSSKVVCLIAYLDAGGNIKVTGIGHQVSQGIRAGIVIDVKQAESSILAAVNAAEKMAGETIDRTIINVSGSSLASHIVDVDARISGHEVTDRDVNQIIQQGYQHFDSEDAEILHCIPMEYAIDDSTGIQDPRGMFGEKLSTRLHVITASTTAVRNLANCLARCHLDIEDYVVSPYVSGLSCLTQDERNLGVTLLDIGAGNTGISVFSGGACVYADSIAVGGLHVTRDIAKGLSTSITHAERIKNLYGNVIYTDSDEREIIDIPTAEDEEAAPGEEKYVSKAILTRIIRPRMEEILEMARGKLESSGLYHMSGPRVVLTGGASQLQGLKELANHIYDKHARIGRPTPVEGLAESTKGPAFSTAVGMLEYAAEKQRASGSPLQEAEHIAKKGTLNKMVKWFQENF